MYASLSHERKILQDEYNRNLQVLQEWERYQHDGLSTLSYEKLEEKQEDLYTKITVNI
jgi:hypothetical protein